MGVGVKCDSVGVLGQPYVAALGQNIVCWPSTVQVLRQPTDLSVGGHL